MHRKHILIARYQKGAPTYWVRSDFDNGRWFSAGLMPAVTGNRPTDIQFNLKALIDGALNELDSGCDLTISPRLALDLIARGDPNTLNVPRGANATIYAPIGREGAPHQSSFWVPILASNGQCNALMQKVFVEKTLKTELRAVLTDSDIQSRNSLHNQAEVWIRHDWTVASICPESAPPYQVQPADPAIELARQEKIAAKARASRVRAASHKSVEAAEANKAAGERYAKGEAAKRARAAAKK